MGSLATPPRNAKVGSRLAGNEANGGNRVLSGIYGVLSSVADLLERRTLICVFLIAGCVAPLAVLEARSTPLSNDEIYTARISQAPTLAAMMHLSREIDLHPPLHYLAQRVALRSGLPRLEAARLPSQLAAIVLCLSLFLWTARRFGNVIGLASVSIFWLSPALDFAWSNRPYMLWLAFLCVLLLARDAATVVGRRWWSVALVFAVTLAMVMTHLLGIACIGPFLLAEMWRAGRNRRMDWPLLLALVLPAMYGAAFYYQIHHLSENAFPASNLPSMDSAIQVYGLIVGNTAVVLTVCLLVVISLFGIGANRTVALRSLRHSRWEFSEEDGLLFLSLLLLPVILLVAMHLMRVQFWLRYGFAAAPAWAVLSAWLVARKFPLARLVAVLVVVASVGCMVQRMFAESGQKGNAGVMAGGRMPIALSSLDASLPIVAASPMTYVEMSDRESPELAKRVFYLTDRNAALQYSHYTLFENEDKIRKLLELPSQTSDLSQFLATQQRFYVVGSYSAPEIWLLRKLAADGLKLEYLGKFASTYKSDDLYVVSR